MLVDILCNNLQWLKTLYTYYFLKLGCNTQMFYLKDTRIKGWKFRNCWNWSHEIWILLVGIYLYFDENKWQGTEDDVVNWLHGNRLWKMAKDPYEPLWIKGGGHCNLELYPDYIRHLCRFIYEMETVTTKTLLSKIKPTLRLPKKSKSKSKSNTDTSSPCTTNTCTCCCIKNGLHDCLKCPRPHCPKCPNCFKLSCCSFNWKCGCCWWRKVKCPEMKLPKCPACLKCECLTCSCKCVNCSCWWYSFFRHGWWEVHGGEGYWFNCNLTVCIDLVAR